LTNNNNTASSKVIPPPGHYKSVRNYPLKNIHIDFAIPPFQRKVKAAHVTEIAKAIMDNRFYGNIIKFYEDKNGKKQVIDGQHTLAALWVCYEKHGLQTYDLLFGIFDESFARNVFMRLNMGKVLTSRDHSKALDDGTNPFFTELKPWLSHERTNSKSTYVEMLNALYYKNGFAKSLAIKNLDIVLQSITKEDIEYMKIFSEACTLISPTVYHSKIYRASIYRNVFSVGYTKKFTKEKFIKLLDLCIKSKKLTDLDTFHTDVALRAAYKIISEELLPKV